nr:uncharacterized mitochondrial protein AtMg00810-like [Tanacetum cinerariifolium]
TEFEKLMHDKFQMSLIGELTFFLGLQVKQKSDGIFISQDKYVDEFLRKFKYADVKPANTPMDKEKALLKDSDGDDELCTEFEKLMHDKFQMSLIGELTFFLGLQVKQKSDGIFISQDKYVDEFLRKFKYADVKPANTPMDKEKALLKDSDGDDVDVYLYRFMIGSLMYLTSSRADIMFVVCTCARF